MITLSSVAWSPEQHSSSSLGHLLTWQAVHTAWHILASLQHKIFSEGSRFAPFLPVPCVVREPTAVNLLNYLFASQPEAAGEGKWCGVWIPLVLSNEA